MGWGGARKKKSVAFKGRGKHELVPCTKPNPCEFLTFRSWSDRMGIWGMLGSVHTEMERIFQEGLLLGTGQGPGFFQAQRSPWDLAGKSVWTNSFGF